MKHRASNTFLRFVAGGWLHWLLALFVGSALFATPLGSMRLLEVFFEPLRLIISAILVSAVGGVVFVLRVHLLSILSRFFELASRLSVWNAIVLGLILRVGWILLFPSQLGSDGAVYVNLAERFAQGCSYETSGTKAYWQVGYPLFQVPWIAVIDDSRLAYLVSNLVVFVLGTLGVASLAKFLAGDRAGNLAVLIFALWPKFVFGIGGRTRMACASLGERARSLRKRHAEPPS